MSAAGSRCDVLVIGGDLDGLIAATTLARSGRKVLLVEEADALGGAYRQIEFAPGYRAAPFAPNSDPTLISLGGEAPVVIDLPLGREVAAGARRTAEGLRVRSARDTERWPVFAQRMQALAGFLAAVYREPAPRIDADSFAEYLSLARLARQYRKLGRRGMTDLLRILPMPVGDLLDDEFETAALKGALAAFAVTDIAQGPYATGTAFTFLHRLVELNATAHHSTVGAPASEANARAAGVTIQLGRGVRSVNVRGGRVSGAVLDSGDEIECATVVSTLDPYRSLLDFVDPQYLDPEFIHAVGNIRFRGVTTKVLVALDALPTFPNLPAAAAAGGPGAAPTGSIVIAPALRQVERAYEAIKYGRSSDEPFIELRFPSVAQSNLAPAGHHVAIVHVQYTPYKLNDANWESQRAVIGDRAIALVDQHLPGFASRVRARSVLAPPDLEERFGLREGAVSQGELALDQILFMRPVPEAARYATPVGGYYLCGPGAHPGVHGLSGYLAARAVMAFGARFKF